MVKEEFVFSLQRFAYIENSASNTLLSGTSGNDSIYNDYGDSVTIIGGAGNDTIDNEFGDNVSITGGAGNDTIRNWEGSNVSINAGAGNDYIYNSWYGDVSVNGGAGNDTLYARSDGSNTMTGGTGSDMFVFYYDSDELYGTDYITDYAEEDTIQFDNAIDKISTNNSGHVIFKVGSYKLVVKNAADKVITYIDSDGSTKTFGGGATNSKSVTLTEGNDTYKNTVEGATIQALGGNDSIYNDGWHDGGNNVTINGGDGDDYIYNYLGDSVSIDGGAGNDSITNYYSDSVTIAGGAGADYIHNSANGSWVTIDGGSGDDYIDNNAGDNISIDAGAGNDSIGNWGDSGTINAGAGNDSIWNNGDSVTINGGAGNDTIRNYSYGGGNTIKGGAGADLFIYETYSGDVDADISNDIITDYSEEDTIQFENAIGKISTNSSGHVIFKVGNHKLVVKNAADKVITYIDSDGNKKTYGGSTADEWKLDGTTATYGSLIVTGVTSLDGLSLNGKVVTVSAASLGTNNVTVSDGYTLKLGSDVSSASTTGKWSLSKTTATYKQTTSAGYSLADNTITYTKKSSKTLATVTGVTSTDGLKVSGKVVTVSAASLGTSKVTISDGYTLKLGDDVNASTTTKAWTIKNSTATYKQTTSAGYSLADNTITYTKKSSKTLATVKGVTSTDGLKVSGKIVTVSAASLGTNKVTISDGYTLKLGSDVEAASTKKAWSFSNSTASYKQTTSASYSLVDNEIIYSAAATKTLASVKGATTKSGLKVSGKTVKLAASALSKKVTVSGAYTFDFASDYSKASITGSSSNDIIIARGKNLSISGGAGNDIFALKPTVANVISDYEEADKISLTSGAAENISVKGSDVIFNKKITVSGGADKIVTYIEGGAEKIFKNKSDDVKYNSDGTGATLAVTYTDDTFNCADFTKYADTLITIDASAINYSLTITGNKRANRIVGGSEDDTLDGGAAADTLLGGNGNDSLVGGKGNDNLNGGNGNDELHGGEGNDKLTGSKGNDTLWGGVGDDTLSGGAGNDVFVYYKDDGNDTIVNYESDVDKIMVLNAVVNSPSVDKAGDVTFKIGSGQIVVEGASNQYIEIVDGVGNQLKVYNPPA